MTPTIWTRRGRPCACPLTQEFADHPGNCHKCGRTTRNPAAAGTWNLAVTIAEIMVGHRRLELHGHGIDIFDN